MCDTAKAVQRWGAIALNECFRKEENSQINNLCIHLKNIENENQNKPKISRRKEIIVIRAKINKTETEEQEIKPMKQRTDSLKISIKVTNFQQNKFPMSRMKQNIIRELADIQMIIKNYYK